MADKVTLIDVRDRLRIEYELVERDSRKFAECAYHTDYQTLEELADAIDAHIAAMGEPVAWLRNGASALRPDPHVITSVVRDLWMNVDPSRVERYTTPLYTAALPENAK